MTAASRGTPTRRMRRDFARKRASRDREAAPPACASGAALSSGGNLRTVSAILHLEFTLLARRQHRLAQVVLHDVQLPDGLFQRHAIRARQDGLEELLAGAVKLVEHGLGRRRE